MTNTLETIEIPRKQAPDKLIQARYARLGAKSSDAYPCIVCGLPVPEPKFMVHMIDGGGRLVAVADEDKYVADGGDMGLYPLGPECARRHPELRPFIHKSMQR